MILVSLALAARVAIVASVSGMRGPNLGSSRGVAGSRQRKAQEEKQQQRKFDPGETFEKEKSSPSTTSGWCHSPNTKNKVKR